MADDAYLRPELVCPVGSPAGLRTRRRSRLRHVDNLPKRRSANLSRLR